MASDGDRQGSGPTACRRVFAAPGVSAMVLFGLPVRMPIGMGPVAVALPAMATLVLPARRDLLGS